MSIVIVGGHDRMHCRYKEICKSHGCKCKVFTQCPRYFKDQLGFPDLCVVMTGTVSHKMVILASEHAAKTGMTIRHCHSSSATALNNFLSEHLSS